MPPAPCPNKKEDNPKINTHIGEKHSGPLRHPNVYNVSVEDTSLMYM